MNEHKYKKNNENKILVEDAIKRYKSDESIFNLQLGNCIGGGISRKVYLSSTNKNKVIKIEKKFYNEMHFQNIIEWQIWNAAKNFGVESFFAKCYKISSCGRVLIQQYAKDVSMYEIEKDPFINEQYLEICKFLSKHIKYDLHYRNFGIIYNKNASTEKSRNLIIRDYGVLDLESISFIGYPIKEEINDNV